MTLSARIYAQSRNVMQSGRAKAGVWILEYEPETNRMAEDVMGWVSSGDSLGQVRLKFPDQESAVAFAKSKDMAYTITPENTRKVVGRTYVDNFKYRPVNEVVKDRR